MEAIRYHRINIKAPGRMNILLDGRFQTVALDDLPQDKLKQLFDNGCSFVGITYGEEFLKDLSPIVTTPINTKREEVKPAEKEKLAANSKKGNKQKHK
jgi:hypothetical protein